MPGKAKTKRRKPKRREPFLEPPHDDAAAFIASQGGPKPFDPIKFRESVKGLWPDDEDIDQFLARRRQEKKGNHIPTNGSPSPKPPTPAERLRELKERAAARGLKPMTVKEYRKHLAKFGRLWADEREIDDFIMWVRRTRKDEG